MQLPDPADRALFLDFDGVICNSINECYVSSWIAFFSRGARLPQAIRIEDRALFARYRPFIRRGGDYVVLQQCIADGVKIESQRTFDKVAREIGASRLETFHREFYQARTALLDEYPDYWLRLNDLYGEIECLLPELAGKHWIITTKEVRFARRILAYHSIQWPAERIICSGTRRKLSIIAERLPDIGRRCAVLIDDQIDHLRPNEYRHIGVVLAAWGFVKPEWITGNSLPVLDGNDAHEYLRKFL